VVIGIMNDEWWSILFEHVIHQPFMIFIIHHSSSAHFTSKKNIRVNDQHHHHPSRQISSINNH